ncbi:uncharacterized protein Pyn_12850 [Prunus yedoensis var. nudiflora]|uniref:Uncharacterized protein n=1 Tax=Prunus yedoensis var. nudiflora TaxID=2094558 RepID=A0A314YA92_PRUYE|nr:uncharacterized protein Pyn_12850 [Prunus yedoensis var. nudiflora]
MPWRHFNVVDEDGRAWYEGYISAKFVWPIEEAVRVALKNADWDPLPPKTNKGKKTPTVLSRLSVQAEATPRAPAAASTTVPASRATAGVATPRTLVLMTMPSPLPVRPSVDVAQGRKRGREAAGTEATAGEAVQAESTAVEEEVPELPRKRLLLILSEGEDEEEVHHATSGATDAEIVAAEAPKAKAAVAEPLPVASVGPSLVMTTVPALVTATPSEPPPVVLHHPSGIVIRSPPRPSLPLSTAITTTSPPVASVIVPSTQWPSAKGELFIITSSPPPTASVSVLMP